MQNSPFDITYLVTTYGYPGLLGIVFLESGIFFLLPGDSLLFTAGLLAPKLGYSLFMLVFLVTIAAYLGGIVGYYIGTKLEYFYRYEFFKRIFKKKYINEAHDFLEKHGLSALIICRFLPVVRTFLPVVAGMAHMNYYDFLRYSFVGSFIWSAVFIWGGYFLGQSFPQIHDYFIYVMVIIVVLSILPGVIHFLKKKK